MKVVLEQRVDGNNYCLHHVVQHVHEAHAGEDSVSWGMMRARCRFVGELSATHN